MRKLTVNMLKTAWKAIKKSWMEASEMMYNGSEYRTA